MGNHTRLYKYNCYQLTMSCRKVVCLLGLGLVWGKLLDQQVPGFCSPWFCWIPSQRLALMHQYWNTYCIYWWWRSYRHEMQGTCGSIQQWYCRDSCNAPASWPSNWLECRLQLTIWWKLHYFGCWVEHSEGLYWNKHCQWINPVIIIGCSSTNLICIEKGL